MEARTQKRLIDYLKSKGCYVIKTKPGVGTPVGCPDVIALNDKFFGGFEVKASEKSRFRPLQKETLATFDKWSFGRVVHPENFDEIIAELETIL